MRSVSSGSEPRTDQMFWMTWAAAAFLGIVACFLGSGLARATAADLPYDPEETILTFVDRNQVVATMSLSEFDALPQREILTRTPWDEGEVVYSGPSLHDLLANLGVPATDLLAQALNNYSIIVPAEVIEEGVPILATRRSGRVMGPREKGPIFVVFPYSDDRYWKPSYFDISIWQLTQLEVIE